VTPFVAHPVSRIKLQSELRQTIKMNYEFQAFSSVDADRERINEFMQVI
jgi:hypothetical protein